MNKGTARIIDHSPGVVTKFRTGRNLLLLGCTLLAGVILLAPSAWFVVPPAFVIVFVGQRLVLESRRIASAETLKAPPRDQPRRGEPTSKE